MSRIVLRTAAASATQSACMLHADVCTAYPDMPRHGPADKGNGKSNANEEETHRNTGITLVVRLR